MIGDSLHWPEASARCCFGRDDECVCTSMEKSIRGWKRGDDMPPMTVDQRELCLAEIGRVEGFVRSEYEAGTDAEVASGVLEAWTEYARDKGLL